MRIELELSEDTARNLREVAAHRGVGVEHLVESWLHDELLAEADLLASRAVAHQRVESCRQGDTLSLDDLKQRIGYTQPAEAGIGG